MATTPRRTGSDATIPAPFSYAQAAKGLSSGPTSSAAASKPSSGSATPAKESQPSAAPAAAVMNWADDAEANDARSEKPSSTRESRVQPPPTAPKPVAAPQASTASIVSSPDIGASSASTVTKDDDVSSIPNTSSDSTWENKSQASTSVEKSESSEKSSEKGEKGKNKNAERTPAKPLQEAPIPVFNVWKQRAEEAKTKTTKPATVKPAPSAGLPNGSYQGAASSVNQSTAPSMVDGTDVKEKPSPQENKPKAREDEKIGETRKDSKPDFDSDRTKKSNKGRPQEKEAKSTAASLPLPPGRDEESWPTPEIAVDENRKKVQGKTEKGVQERKEGSSTKAGSKKEWVNMAITPNVIFNTPLPNSQSSRRGGRGARGGVQGGSRTGGFAASNPEKDGSASAALPNGDQPKRGRGEGFAREASPKGKRLTSPGSLPSKDKAATINGEKTSKNSTADAEVSSRRASVLTESNGGSQFAGQNNTFPRQYPSGRPNKGRRGDFSGPERRRDGDSVSPTKENAFNDRRTSSATQTDVPEDSERRGPNSTGDQASYQSKRGSNDRQFGSFSSRDRNRGGGRGGRGNYQNGHQFANGHMPAPKSSTVPGPLSPTAFNPDQNAFFPSNSGRYRNGPRSQSVTTENMYRAPGQYGGPQQMPPINTYMGNMYDYQMMQPMSAVPYGPFGVDHYTLLAMVTTQLEYYFSLENLCKDMYLRKHMDSQGFVFLAVIADFNRIKHLTTDMELIKLVCYQSRTIEFRIGHDGKDRLRRREGWEQWVLPVPQRDASAQNDGPGELYNPPIPHPNGFDPNGLPRYPEMPATSPTASATFGGEGQYPAVNGFHPGAAVHPTGPHDNLTNGAAPEGANGSAIPNGHPIDNSTKAVSGEPDSFSDEQVESLTVVVRKQDPSQIPALPPSAIRTFSNGSIDSRSGVSEQSEKIAGRQAGVKVNGTGPSLGVKSKVQDPPSRTSSPFAPSSSAPPVRLYWVKDQDGPVDFVPPDSTHESYQLLRSKALQQRQNTVPGNCPYDMNILYQFWSHFLIRNFNNRMYDEFRHFAFTDAANDLSEVGLTNLIKFYGESLSSTQNLIRERVARDYVDLVRSENEHRRPAFKQLQSALRNVSLDPRNRNRIDDLLDDELKASLE